ncbi:MAG: hypothetical protein JXB60_09025 [Candidatus Cloacimonetes bacterium]|nr:hypothetical protein [Candidatus Cloacimonadota bacterium]MBN2863256.1 hypothetical protein [Bacteroidales bacterium]
MKKLLFLAAACLLALPVSGQFTGKMKFNSMGKTRSFTVHSSDEGYRYDFDESGQKGALIVKNDSRDVIILMPQQRMAMKSPSENPMSISNDPLKSLEYYQASGLMKEAGKESINGVMCNKSIMYNKDNPTQEMFTLWYSDQYKFPMKMVNHIDGTENSGMEMSEVKPWSPDPQIFEIPAGYNVMDVPGMLEK